MILHRNRILLLVFAFCIAISSAGQTVNIDSIINPISSRRIVETLAADSFSGRLAGTVNEEMAGLYIVEEFKKLGLSPGLSSGYFMPFSVEWNHKVRESQNVVAFLPGKTKPDEWVVFSAHYDHVGTRYTNPVNFVPEKGKPEKGDSIYNGANDNASGTTALILLARYFARAANNDRTIIFIAFTGEELGLLGSKKAVFNLNNRSIVAMINMDMLGRPISTKKKNPYITGSQYSDLPSILNNQLYVTSPAEYGKNFFRKDPYPGESLFTRSDNFPFAEKGIAAHTIMSSSPRDPFYHSLNDEPATLDYEFLSKIIKAVALASTGLIDGSKTPLRIDPLKIID